MFTISKHYILISLDILFFFTVSYLFTVIGCVPIIRSPGYVQKNMFIAFIGTFLFCLISLIFFIYNMCTKYKGNFTGRMITRGILECILAVSFICSLVRLFFIVLLVPLLYSIVIIVEVKYHKEIEESKKNIQNFKTFDGMNSNTGYQIM